MAMTIDQVPVWLILDRNIGHAVAAANSGWYTTGCGVWTPNGRETRERPARVCRKCRASLKDATLVAPPR